MSSFLLENKNIQGRRMTIQDLSTKISEIFKLISNDLNIIVSDNGIT